MLYLIGTCGVHAGQEILIENEIVIGRDPSICQLVYPSHEKGVSGVHCKVQNINGVIHIQDMGSTNGTFLETGVRLDAHVPQVLQAGQSFYLGDRGNSYMIQDKGNVKKNAIEQNHEKGNKINSQNIEKKAGTGSANGIGISIASLSVAILAVILGIASIFVDVLKYPTVIFSVAGIGLGVTSHALHFKGNVMAKVGTICSAVTVVALVGGMLYGALQPKTLVGSWTCVEVQDAKDALVGAFEEGMVEAGMSPGLAVQLVEMLHLNGDLIFTFSESGSLYLSGESGLGAGLDIIDWEDTQDGYVMITVDLSQIEIVGTSVPIKVGYRAAYEMKGDTASMDFFGITITLKRIKE